MEPAAPHVSGEGRSHDAPLPRPSQQQQQQQQLQEQQQKPSRYESQKRRDWNTFLQFLANRKLPLPLARCGGAHVVEFLEYLDQFGKTKVHASGCAFFGHPHPPGPCECPTKQAWGSLDALIGRLRAAYEENGGRQESNPFGTKAVKAHLREVRESQAKARGVAYEKKRKRRQPSSAVNEGSSRDHPITAAPPAEVASLASSSTATDSSTVRDSPAS